MTQENSLERAANELVHLCLQGAGQNEPRHVGGMAFAQAVIAQEGIQALVTTLRLSGQLVVADFDKHLEERFRARAKAMQGPGLILPASAVGAKPNGAA